MHLLLILITSFFYVSTTFAEDPSEPMTKKTDESFKTRKSEENQVKRMKFAILPHRPFYILPVSYNSTPSKGSLVGLSEVDYLEAKFQFSFKLSVVDSFWNNHMSVYFAYTNLSLWQLYNSANSAPFRETNHEPELFVEYHPDSIDSLQESHFYRFGFDHQSNGQDVPESRSWNRIFAQGIFNFGHLAAQLKAWYRLPESEKDSPLAAGGDDNPDILLYMGNFELNLIQKIGQSTLTALIRNNLRKDNRGAIELSWSFPLNENYRGYVQFFNGYGETLIDYNHPISRIGAGFLLVDWL